MKFIAYTDGAYNVNTRIGASAVVILNEDKTKILYQWAKARRCTQTDEKMQFAPEQELGAVIRAIMSVPDHSYIKIYSDSMYAVKVLSGQWEAHVNQELIARYMEEKEKRHIVSTMIWVKGHNGDTYNELADELCANISSEFWNGGKNVFETKNLCYDDSENLQ